MYVKVKDSEKLDPYSDEYEEYIGRYTDYISQISQEVLSKRITALKAEYTVKVADAEIEYATTKADVELQIENGRQQVEQILDMAENGDRNLVEYKKQYNEKATEAAEKIDASKLEHSTQYASWEAKRNEYNEAMKKVQENSNAGSHMYRVEVINIDAAYILSVFFSFYDKTNLSCGEQVAVVEQKLFNLIKRIWHFPFPNTFSIAD